MIQVLKRWARRAFGIGTMSSELRDTFNLNPTHAGVEVSVESSLRMTAVFACVRVLSEGVAGLPLHVYRRNGEGREKAVDHPLYYLLHQEPNSFQTAFAFKQLLMVHVLTWGNAYAEIVRNENGQVTALWPMRPEAVFVRSEKGELFYEYSLNGNRVRLNQDRVLHIRGLSTDGILGLSPIAAARQSIGLSLAAERFGAQYFGSGSRLGGVIEMEGMVGPETIRQVRDVWDQTYANPNAWHSVAVLGPDMKFKPFEMNNEDAQFIETRRFGVEDIARVYRVPPHMLADLSKANYSNVDALDRAFVQHSLAPWAVTIEQSFTKKLLGPRERQRTYCEFDLNGVLRGDPSARMRTYQAGIQSGIYSPNECRAFENLNPREGGDVYLQPVNLAPSPFDPSRNDNGNDTQNQNQNG